MGSHETLGSYAGCASCSGVVGSGVGLLDSEPVVEIYVAGRGDSGLEQAIAEIADFEFVLVSDSQPAEAHASDRDAKE